MISSIKIWSFGGKSIFDEMLYMVILLLIWVKLSNCTSQASSLTLDRIVRIVGAGGLITSKLWTIQFMRTW